MVADIDIFRTANLLIRQHGADAPIEAVRRADDMLARGNIDGATVWRRVGAAVEALQAEAGTVH